jgi:hypothetical protein
LPACTTAYLRKAAIDARSEGKELSPYFAYQLKDVDVEEAYRELSPSLRRLRTRTETPSTTARLGSVDLPPVALVHEGKWNESRRAGALPPRVLGREEGPL